MKRKSILYKIINLKNRHWYVGSSVSTSRKNTHFCELRNNRHTNSWLQNAWNLYGPENFKFKVFCEYDNREDAANAENKILQKHQGKSYCYNLSKDAYGYTIGPLKEETKEKISKSLKGRQSKRIGIVESDELKRKRKSISQAMMSNLSDDERKKFGKKRIKSQEEIDKIRNGLIGRKHSPETIEKMKISRLRRLQRSRH